MGEGYGPMIISNKEMSEEEAKSKVIAIPGLGTSAYLSLRLAWGDVKVEVVPFDEILPKVANGEFDAGLIIHEGQLTWESEGVYLVLDLGIWWESLDCCLLIGVDERTSKSDVQKLHDGLSLWLEEVLE